MRGSFRQSIVRRAQGAPSPLDLFIQGFVALLPLWAGAIPVGIAYGIAARDAGLGLAETQLMSLTVFSAAGQVSAVSLLNVGASIPVLVVAALALNVQLLLLGLAAGRQLHPSLPARLVAAYFLTDGAYGIAVGGGKLTLPRLVGAGVSMFVAWNAGTAIGAAAGHAIADPRRLGVDFVVTLAFLAVLVALVRTRAAVMAALVAGASMFLLARLAPGGVAVLGAGLAGSIVGAWWARRDRESSAVASTKPEDGPR